MDIKGIALAKQMDDRRNVLRYPNGPLSPAAPIVPTYTGFEDAPPTNLENATDGDITTCTGVAQKILGTAGTGGTFVFDMGEVRSVLVGFILGVKTTASTLQLFIESSDDNITYRTASLNNNATSSTSKVIRDGLSSLLTGRYIRIRAVNTGAGTIDVEVYQCMAYELVI
jgi:hypothetical protein